MLIYNQSLGMRGRGRKNKKARLSSQKEEDLNSQQNPPPQKAETSRKTRSTENSDSDKENVQPEILSKKRKASSEAFEQSDTEDDFLWTGELGDNPIGGSQIPIPTGGLISESFSLFLKSPKQGAKSH